MARYMTDGRECGQRVEYVGLPGADLRRFCARNGSPSRNEEVGVPTVGDEVGVSTVGDLFRFRPESVVVDAVASVYAWMAAVEGALSAGYSGLRAVVDSTSLVRTPEQRNGFARFEHLIDHEIGVMPVTAMCALDVSQLGDVAVAEMACLHPFVNNGYAPFRLFADGPGLKLTGDVDISCTDLFDMTLSRVLPLSWDSELIVDIEGLTFIDHQGLLALDRHARERHCAVVLRNASRTVRRVAELLPLEGLRLETGR